MEYKQQLMTRSASKDKTNVHAFVVYQVSTFVTFKYMSLLFDLVSLIHLRTLLFYIIPNMFGS